MTAQVTQMRDLVHVHITADLPVRARTLPFADRLEIRFGNAYPVALIVDRAALDGLAAAIQSGRAELEAADTREEKGASS
jgi:hypothetical protein